MVSIIENEKVFVNFKTEVDKYYIDIDDMKIQKSM